MADGRALDRAEVERAAARWRLRLPRAALAGPVGGVTGARAGGSLELHDFREYQPGDDLRQVDWNAEARTGQLFVRVRREEVAPRVEVVLDASRSMAVTAAKEQRARELAALFLRLAQAQGLQSALCVANAAPARRSPASPELVDDLAFDGRQSLWEALQRAPLLRPCGMRLVVSDFLFEAPLDALTARLAQGTGSLALIQVLDPQDERPEPAAALVLVDSETGERIEREADADLVATYRRRLEAHLASLVAAGRRVRAATARTSAAVPLGETVRAHLAETVLEVRS